MRDTHPPETVLDRTSRLKAREFRFAPALSNAYSQAGQALLEIWKPSPAGRVCPNFLLEGKAASDNGL